MVCERTVLNIQKHCVFFENRSFTNHSSTVHQPFIRSSTIRQPFIKASVRFWKLSRGCLPASVSRGAAVGSRTEVTGAIGPRRPQGPPRQAPAAAAASRRVNPERVGESRASGAHPERVGHIQSKWVNPERVGHIQSKRVIQRDVEQPARQLNA